MLRLLAMSIAMVVASRAGADPIVQPRSAAVVASFCPRAADDSLKVGGRLEPRVFPAPLLDRLPPVLPLLRVGTAATTAPIAVTEATLLEGRSDDGRRSILKHVPRMERGDPPKA